MTSFTFFLYSSSISNTIHCWHRWFTDTCVLEYLKVRAVFERRHSMYWPAVWSSLAHTGKVLVFLLNLPDPTSNTLLINLSSTWQSQWPICTSFPLTEHQKVRPSLFLYTALKSPAAFHEQRKSLERARVSDYLFFLLKQRILFLLIFDTFVDTQLFYLLLVQTEDYLKRKIRSRPERSELVRMHILEGECHIILI